MLCTMCMPEHDETRLPYRTAIAAHHAVHINRIAVGSVIPMLVQALASPAAATPAAQQLLRQVLDVAEGLGSLPPPPPEGQPPVNAVDAPPQEEGLPALRSEWFSLTAYLFSSACVLPPATLEQAIGGGGLVFQVNAMVNASWFVDSLHGKIDRCVDFLHLIMHAASCIRMYTNQAPILHPGVHA